MSGTTSLALSMSYIWFTHEICVPVLWALGLATEEGALTCIEELHLKRMFVTEKAARLLVQCHAQGLLANLKVRVHVADAAAEKPTCSAQQDRDLTHTAAAFPM